MRTPSLALLAAGTIGVAALSLAIIGAPGGLKPPAPAARPQPVPASVAAGGFTLASASVDLPDDDRPYPAGPHADVVDAHCTACHSASMVLSQPPLSTEQWQAEVTKMREVYKAPVAAADVPAIVAYLSSLGTPDKTPVLKPAG